MCDEGCGTRSTDRLADAPVGTRVVNRLTTPPGARDVRRSRAWWGSFLLQRLLLAEDVVVVLGEAVCLVADGLAEAQAEVLA